MDATVNTRLTEAIDKIRATISAAVYNGELDLAERLIPVLRELESKVASSPEKADTREETAFHLLTQYLKHVQEEDPSMFEKNWLCSNTQFDESWVPRAKELTGIK